MKLRKMAAMLLSVMLVFSLSITAFAQSPPEAVQESEVNISITPFWVNVNNITLDLSFTGGDANCYGKIAGASGTTSIDATLKLEKKTSTGWSFVNSWSKSSSSTTLTVTGANAASKGSTYRITVTATVVRNGVSETVSTSVEATY